MATNKETESKSRPSLLYTVTSYPDALLGAWYEPCINCGCIMLSLVSVTTAVWAIATVITLGNILTSSQGMVAVQSTGIADVVTLTVGADSSGFEGGGSFGSGDFGGDNSVGTMIGSFGSFDGTGVGGSGPDDLSTINPDGPINDVFPAATYHLVETTHANSWS